MEDASGRVGVQSAAQAQNGAELVIYYDFLRQ